MKQLPLLRVGLSLCIAFFLSNPTFAQKQISGTVQDANGNLSYANILLLAPTDSSLVKGNVTDADGKYQLEDIAAGDYLLQVSMIGYDSEYSDLFTLQDQAGDFSIPPITLAESSAELGEVQVTAKRALIEQQIDRMVVNVDNSITSAGNTALEVLRRSPGVIVNPQANTISMSGKEGVVIMLNGKISRVPMDALIQMLGGMSSDNIDKIELIHTPPSNFEAEGNAGYINIVLKKNQNEGINGGYSLTAGYGKKEKLGASMNFNYRKNKVNLFGDYSWNYNNNPQLFTSYRSFVFDGKTIENYSEGTRDPTTTHVQNAQLGIDIQLSDKTVVGGLVSWLDRDWNLDAVNRVEQKENGNITSLINIPNTEINHSYRFLGNVNVQHQIKKGHQLNFDLDYAYFYNENPSNYLNQFMDAGENILEENELRVSKLTPLKIFVGKLDHSKTIGENMTWDIGIKGTMTSFDNDVLVENKVGSVWERSALFSSEAMMTEDIAAAYSSISWKVSDKFNVKAGLRYEYTDSNLGTVEEPNIVDREYGRLFPSLFISNKINDNNTLQFSYSRRINRPSFNQLAPWFYFIDPNTVLTGNPQLQPSLTDALRITYLWKTVNLGVQYSYVDEAIGRFQPTVNQETNTQVNGAKNFIDAQNFSSTLSFPLTIKKWWDFQTSWTVGWQQINDEIEEKKVSFSQTSWSMNASSTIKLPRQFSIEVSGVYFSPSLGGAIVWQDFNNVNFGIQKQLGNGAKLGFSVNDLFLGGNWRGRLEDSDVNFIYEGYFGFSERVFRLTFSNRFGNSKMKGSRNRKTGSAEEQRRTN